MFRNFYKWFSAQMLVKLCVYPWWNIYDDYQFPRRVGLTLPRVGGIIHPPPLKIYTSNTWSTIQIWFVVTSPKYLLQIFLSKKQHHTPPGVATMLTLSIHGQKFIACIGRDDSSPHLKIGPKKGKGEENMV